MSEKSLREKAQCPRVSFVVHTPNYVRMVVTYDSCQHIRHGGTRCEES